MNFAQLFAGGWSNPRSWTPNYLPATSNPPIARPGEPGARRSPLAEITAHHPQPRQTFVFAGGQPIQINFYPLARKIVELPLLHRLFDAPLRQPAHRGAKIDAFQRHAPILPNFLPGNRLPTKQRKRPPW